MVGNNDTCIHLLWRTRRRIHEVTLILEYFSSNMKTAGGAIFMLPGFLPLVVVVFDATLECYNVETVTGDMA